MNHYMRYSQAREISTDLVRPEGCKVVFARCVLEEATVILIIFALHSPPLRLAAGERARTGIQFKVKNGAM